jgi:hypothetical protein
MSNVGKTMVKGHGLQWEGGVVFDADGNLAAGRLPQSQRYAKCRCGALSDVGLSQYRAKKWHRQHKADVLAAEDAR